MVVGRRGAFALPCVVSRRFSDRLVRYSRHQQLFQAHTELCPGQIHIWWLHTDKASITLPHWENCHTQEDRRELSTTADPATRRIRKLARTHLRTTLARYLEVEPTHLSFRRGQHGKPQLQDPLPGSALSTRIQFNLSHTRSLIGCAVALDWAVGLDIENLDRKFKVSPVRLAKHNFSAAEVEHLEGLESEEAQQQHFLRIWNLKEAFCKAQGLGIISTMRHHTFSISRAPDELPGQLGLEADPCRLRASNGKAGQIMQSCMDNQPAWQVKLQPSCDHAYFSVFDVNQAHTAAVCLLGPQGSLPVDTFAAAPIIKHFWPHENTAYLQTLRPGRQITGLRRL